MKSRYRLSRALVAAVAFSAGTAFAGPAVVNEKMEAPKETDWCDSIWSLATLYKDENNPVIQEFSLLGRYHGQYYQLDSEQGDDEDWEHRRFRYGFKATLFHDFEIKAEAFGNLDVHDWYAGITEVSLGWKPNDQFNLLVGKQKPRFSLDWSTSSREILTMERNVIINSFGIDYETGVSVSGKSGKWSYYGGVFNNDVMDADEIDMEFGNLDGGWSYIASVGYDVKEFTGTEKGVLRLDYIHSEHDLEDDLLTRFDDGVALSLNLKQAKWGVVAEGLYAENDAGEVWGVYVMPSYDITERLQVVARYTYGHSGDDQLSAQRRYERAADGFSGSGESYNAGYVGLNYYICGHRLKLMTGVEYSEMDGGPDGGDFEGWTWTSGVRMYW